MIPDFLQGVQPEAAEPVVPNHHATREDDDKPRPFGGVRRSREPRQAATPRKEKPAPPYEAGQYTQALVDLYSMVAFVAMPFKPELAVTIMGPCRAPTEKEPDPPSVAENCADAWDKAAKQSPTVRRMLAAVTATTVWGSLATAHAPILAAAVAGTPLAEKMNAGLQTFVQRRQEQDEPTE